MYEIVMCSREAKFCYNFQIFFCLEYTRYVFTNFDDMICYLEPNMPLNAAIEKYLINVLVTFICMYEIELYKTSRETDIGIFVSNIFLLHLAQNQQFG